MAQKLTQQQIQEQRLLQQQRITQQHLLNVRLLGMSLTELEQNVMAELDDNPALEESFDEAEFDSVEPQEDSSDAQDYEVSAEQEERQDELNKALESMESDDEPAGGDNMSWQNADYEEMVYGDTLSFYDKLNEQVGELELTDTERAIMEYLIGNLDSDGLLRKDLGTIADELAIYEYIDTSVAEVEHILQMLQTFDPAGIGARSLQECLRLQIERMEESRLKEYMLDVVDNHFEAFTKKHWAKLQTDLGLSDMQMETLIKELRRLNPKPGSALGESLGRSTQQITPDFIVYTTDDGRVLFDINNGNLPGLTISESFEEMMSNYRKADEKALSKADRDAITYMRNKMEKASWYIEAIRQRQQTMRLTMQAIINRQKKYFLDGDESDLRPMILKDIAEATGLDISTISRVSNEKYAQTRWGTYPLRFFFTDGYTNEEGEELSTRKIKLALKELISKEDKKSPLSDEAIVAIMKKQGFPIARRTVAKYRNQMGIPKSTLRRG